MRSHSKLPWALGLLLATGLVWQGCQNKQPSAAAMAQPAKDLYSLFAFTSADLGLVDGTPGSFKNIGTKVNFNLYTEPNEPPLSACLAKVSDYGVTPVTVISGPLPYSIFNSSVYSTYNPEGHPYSASTYTNSPQGAFNKPSNFVWTAWYEYFIVSTGLSDPYAGYGVSIVGLINDPENAAYPPGPGNIDPIAFEYYPYSADGQNASAGFNGNPGQYDLTPFQGFQFYVYIDPSDTAPERIFLVNTYQTQPNQLPPTNFPGGCNNPSSPFLNHCYDSFEYDFTNTPKGQWVLIQKNWGDFKQFGFGSVTNPQTLSGVNLQQFQFFQWVESNAAQAGLVTVDYTLAGMRFF